MVKKLEDILNNGEDSFVEFKEENVHPSSLAKEMAAFANTEGGCVYLGVSDDGEISGLSRPDAEEWVFNVARNNVKPAILPLFEKVASGDKLVAKIRVNKDLAGPFSVNGRYYVRVGSTSRECTKEELARLFQRSRQVYFEETPIYDADENHLDRYKIQEYFSQVYDYNIEQDLSVDYTVLLQNSGLLTQERHATVVGLVIFARRDAGATPPLNYLQKFLPQAGAVYAHYAGSEITDELLDRVNFEERAPELVEKVSEKVLLRLSTPSSIKGMKREDKTALPKKVLREVLVNAVIHRNYSLQGKIRIFQFDDRLEVASPGALPNSVTIDKMKTSYSIHHNPLIVKFMENLRYIDGLGRGVPMIFREMKRLEAKPPEIFADETQVRVVVYFAPTD